MGSPELDLALQMWPCYYQVEGKVYLPEPAGKAVPYAVQDTSVILWRETSLLAYVPLVYQDPQVFL